MKQKPKNQKLLGPSINRVSERTEPRDVGKWGPPVDPQPFFFRFDQPHGAVSKSMGPMVYNPNDKFNNPLAGIWVIKMKRLYNSYHIPYGLWNIINIITNPVEVGPHDQVGLTPTPITLPVPGL